MPAYPHIQQYREELQRLLEFGGSDNESSIRRAFAVCLDLYCREHRERLALVDDQYKEKKPRDPTIAAKFNTYRFADYKEQVIDLLRRVCTVSVRTMEVVDGMAYWDGEYLVVSDGVGDRDKNEWMGG